LQIDVGQKIVVILTNMPQSLTNSVSGLISEDVNA